MKFARILYDDEIYYAKYDNSSDMFELIENEVELAAIEEAYNTIFIDEE